MTTSIVYSEHGALAKKFVKAVDMYQVLHATRQYWAYMDIITVLDIVETGEIYGRFSLDFYQNRVNEIRQPSAMTQCVLDKLVEKVISVEWENMSEEQRQRSSSFGLHP